MGKTSVYVCGCGHDGRLGQGNEKNCPSLIPVRGALDEIENLEIVSVAVGGFHTFVVTKAHGVFAFGLGEDGQLGTGELSSAQKPKPVDFFTQGGRTVTEDLIAIKCGAYHTIAWMKDGLYACGKNDDGQLGLSDNDNRKHFTKISSIEPENILDVSCGSYHTLILLKDMAIEDIDADAMETGADGNLAPQQRMKVIPFMLASCGKGDFGELGYNADSWDTMDAKQKLLQHQMAEKGRHMAMGGDAAAFESNLIDGVSGGGGGGGRTYAGDDVSQEEAETNGAELTKPMSSGVPNLPSHVPMKKPFAFKKPANQKKRRTFFTHSTFKMVPLPNAEDLVKVAATGANDAGGKTAFSPLPPGDNATTTTATTAICSELTIKNVSAMHHHSAFYAEESSSASSSTCVWHFGCYYCNEIEGNESSIPRPLTVVAGSAAGGEGGKKRKKVDGIHCGDEIIMAWKNPTQEVDAKGDDKEEKELHDVELYVAGSGNLGCGDNDDETKEWKRVQLPPLLPPSGGESAATGTTSITTRRSIEKISGKSHFLITARITTTEYAVDGQVVDQQSTPSSVTTTKTVVYVFGDNFMSQLGVGRDDIDNLAEPAVLPLPSSSTSVGAEEGRFVVLDAQAGFRHTVVLLEEQ